METLHLNSWEVFNWRTSYYNLSLISYWIGSDLSKKNNIHAGDGLLYFGLF